jgi:hypothetical protein
METIFEFKNSQYKTFQYENFCQIPDEIIDDSGKKTKYYNKTPTYTRPNEIWVPKNDCIYGEEEFVKNYANQFASVFLNRIKVIVTKEDDKVSVKYYVYNLYRNVSKRFFKKETRMRYITYNFKTNSLYDGFIVNYHKKKKFTKKVRKNSFWNYPLEGLIGEISSGINSINNGSFDLINKGQILFEIEKKFTENIPGNENYKNLKGSQKIYKIFADRYQLKLPNNWDSFFGVYPYIKIKELRSNDMKFVDTFMYKHDLTGDKIKRVLHKIKKFSNTSLLKWAYNFFGTDFILGQEEDFLIKLIEFEDSVYSETNYSDSFTKAEKQKIFKIFNMCLTKNIGFSTLYDHLYMLYFIKKYEKIKWGSNTLEEFLEEHSLLTNKVSFYKNGSYIRHYNSEFITQIEKPFNGYCPFLLKNTQDYNNESFIQSNCVKTYIDKPASIIISLRKGDNHESNERATVEFYLYKVENKIKIKSVQKTGKFNSGLNEEWKSNIEILESKFNELIEYDIFKIFKTTYKTGMGEKSLGLKFYDLNDNFEPYSNYEGYKPSIGQLYFYDENQNNQELLKEV